MKYLGNSPPLDITTYDAERYDYVFYGNPTDSVNPSCLYATWLNASTGEVFVCRDNTVDQNVWTGQLGTLIKTVGFLSFVGASSHSVALPAIYSLGTGDFTIESKIRTTDVGFNYFISNKNNFTGNFVRIGLGNADGTIRFYVEGTDGTNSERNTTAEYNDDEWHHVAVTRTGTTMEIFVDGFVVYTSSSIVSGDFGGATNWYLGQSGTGSSYFTGDLAMVRVWSKVLSQYEIADSSREVFNISDAALEAYYPFTDGSGSILSEVISGNHGTITGATWGSE